MGGGSIHTLVLFLCQVTLVYVRWLGLVFPFFSSSCLAFLLVAHFSDILHLPLSPFFLLWVYHFGIRGGDVSFLSHILFLIDGIQSLGFPLNSFIFLYCLISLSCFTFLYLLFLPRVCHFEISRTVSPLRSISSLMQYQDLVFWLICVVMSLVSRSSPRQVVVRGSIRERFTLF